MVLESLISIKEAIKRPWSMFIVGGIVSVLCLFISFIVFPNFVGLATNFLITITMAPFMLKLIAREEANTAEELEKHTHGNFLEKHSGILSVYAAFFGGMILFLSLVFLTLPEGTVQKLFQDQITEIDLIRGNAIFGGTLERIVFNNIGVLILSVIFSFLLGVGAIFILAWNASILATAIGLTAKSIGGFHSLPVAVLVYFPHGSLEILAYFIGAVAGGLISAAFTRRGSKMFWPVAKDSFVLVGIAVTILVAAGLVETASIAVSG